MRLGWLALTAAVTASAGAWAGPPPAADSHGPAWDDSHMQTRYQETPRANRPRLTGESGYGALASGSSESSKQVPEGIEYTSQRQWIQGALTKSSKKPEESATKSSSSGKIFRGSALRSGAVSSRRR